MVKTRDGQYLKIEQVCKKNILRVIDEEDIVIIQDFFGKQFIGIYDRDIYTLVNTNIEV